jgi:hypothetical protein
MIYGTAASISTFRDDMFGIVAKPYPPAFGKRLVRQSSYNGRQVHKIRKVLGHLPEELTDTSVRRCTVLTPFVSMAMAHRAVGLLHR